MAIEFSNFIFFVTIFLYLGISGLHKYIKNTSIDYKSEFLNLSLFLSMLFIISLTLFPIRFGYKYKGFEILSIVPFRTIKDMIFKYPIEEFVLNIIGNIVLFVPFGFFTYIKCKKSKTKALLAILILTITIELIQGFIPYRYCDIDDIILNSFGGYIGIIIYNILASKFHNSKKIQITQ